MNNITNYISGMPSGLKRRFQKRWLNRVVSRGMKFYRRKRDSHFNIYVDVKITALESNEK